MASKEFVKQYTPYAGLWYQRKGYYTSQTFLREDLLRDIPEKTKLIVRFNKYYGKNENKNRPKFQFSFSTKVPTDANTYLLGSVDGDIDDADYEPLETSTVVRLDQAVEICNSLLRDCEYGYSIDDLVVESASFLRRVSFEAIPIEDEEE